jgi:dTDP-4-dehydrorhamnose 3,5-epimerase
VNFTSLPVRDAWLIGLDVREDNRGFFARVFCQDEFACHQCETRVVQVNNSWSKDKATLRGMHYQLPPKQETKVIRCISGSVFDVVLDLRSASPTFGRWHSEVLSADNRKMMYVPRGCAHGFFTLEPQSEIIYLVSEAYAPECERGVRWNDPKFAIAWPDEPRFMSEKDATYPYFDVSYHLSENMG